MSTPTTVLSGLKIFKYPFRIEDTPTIEIQCGHRILFAGLDPGGTPCIWAQVNPAASMSSIQLYVIGTGRPIPASANNYISSFVQGSSVWHIYTA